MRERLERGWCADSVVRQGHLAARFHGDRCASDDHKKLETYLCYVFACFLS